MQKEILQIGICDTHKEDLDRIVDAISESLEALKPPVQVVCRCFLDGEELYRASRETPFQLLFLEIDMPNMDGFELAGKFLLDRPRTPLIFVSAQERFVFDALEYTPLWFVRKSCLAGDIYRAVRKYFQITIFTRVTYRLKDGFGARNLPIQDILYIECSGHHLTIQKTDGSSLTNYGSLKSMEEELEGCGFLRIHKNYLVNQQYIKEVGKREVYLTDNSVLEMGRDRRPAIRDAMLRYEKEYQQRQGG